MTSNLSCILPATVVVSPLERSHHEFSVSKLVYNMPLQDHVYKQFVVKRLSHRQVRKSHKSVSSTILHRDEDAVAWLQ